MSLENSRSIYNVLDLVLLPDVSKALCVPAPEPLQPFQALLEIRTKMYLV